MPFPPPPAPRIEGPVCDAHVHVSAARPFDCTCGMLRGLMERFGMDRLAVMALPSSSRRGTDSPLNNLVALACKARLNAEGAARRVHACAGLRHFGPDSGTPEGLLAQARRAIALGVDGFKMLEGKPRLRRRPGAALDGPLYEPFFAWAEEEGWPITMHSCDPARFWDAAAPADAAEHGWAYDASYPSLAALRAETENVLRRHPRLRLMLAHLFFLGDDPDEAERMLAAYPGLTFDLTPGGEMYAGITARRDVWRPLFERRADRFFFGTDCDNWHCSDDLTTYDWNFGFLVRLVLDMLGEGEPFRFHDADLGELVPLALPERARRAIVHDNFVARFGAEPRPVATDLAAEDAAALADSFADFAADAGIPPDRLAAERSLAGEIRAFFARG